MKRSAKRITADKKYIQQLLGWLPDNRILRVCWSHIRFKLDYGCIAYGSARRLYLGILDPIVSQGWLSCSGSFQTLPVEDEPAILYDVNLYCQ